MKMPTIPKLLSRDEFREGVFERDNHKCVLCGDPVQDAHHIIERRLWPDSGYYFDNGASVCGDCHFDCERTIVSVETVREACGIEKILLPPHLYSDQAYDKWGNPIMPNGSRLKGELFFDDSVQKVLQEGGVLSLFTNWIKYPRTYHCPWSEGVPSDDRMVDSMDGFIGKMVVVTEKMDGENTTMYNDHIHARSVDSKGHWSRDRIKAMWSQIMGDIPEGMRICGENLYATHSIEYKNLESYFLGFGIWDEMNKCLSWDETILWLSLFNIKTVPVLYEGIYDEDIIKSLYNKDLWDSNEGYVIRIADSFNYSEFRHSVAKFVRKDHVQTSKHWMRGNRDIGTNSLGEKY